MLDVYRIFDLYLILSNEKKIFSEKQITDLKTYVNISNSKLVRETM